MLLENDIRRYGQLMFMKYIRYYQNMYRNPMLGQCYYNYQFLVGSIINLYSWNLKQSITSISH